MQLNSIRMYVGSEYWREVAATGLTWGAGVLVMIHVRSTRIADGQARLGALCGLGFYSFFFSLIGKNGSQHQ